MVFFKVAGVAAFGLSLTLTACDHSSNNNLGFAAEDDPFASASSSSTVPNGDLGSSASTEGLKKYMTCDKTIEGLYLKYLYSDSSDSDYAFFKCENGEWKPVADNLVLRGSGVLMCLQRKLSFAMPTMKALLILFIVQASLAVRPTFITVGVKMANGILRTTR